MNRLAFFSESTLDAERLRRQLSNLFEVHCAGLEQIPHQKPERYTLVAANLTDSSRLPVLKEWMKSKPKDGKVIFVTRGESHIENTRALALGAADVVHRPITAKALLKSFFGDVAPLASEVSDFAAQGGAAQAHSGLQSIFASACLGEQLDASRINSASSAIVTEIESQGLSTWIDTVRKHHSQTYQHCLLVTGVAVAFGHHLGLSAADRQRLSFAGMLHDVGKARIPIEILEKPGPLDQDELAVMRTHPELGLEALKSAEGIQAEMADIVVHHHEYLDGSGYPHGLCAREISDLVRMMTISDVFGALLERRSYKPPLSSTKAYEILLDMGPKLDKDLVREFHSVMQAA